MQVIESYISCRGFFYLPNNNGLVDLLQNVLLRKLINDSLIEGPKLQQTIGKAHRTKPKNKIEN